MNKLTVICLGLIVGGCATTDQQAESNAKIQELEKKIARIEGDLYKVEVKSAPKQVAEPKFVPAKEVEQNVIDTKINAFIKEYLGVQFGDSIDKFPQTENRSSNTRRGLPVLKKFQHFDKAEGVFEDGKLCGVRFYTDIDKKYSEDSSNEQINQTLSDMAVMFGLSSTVFGRYGGNVAETRRLMREKRKSRLDGTGSTYSLKLVHGGAPLGFRRLGAEIEDQHLKRQYAEERKNRERATGEKLPDAK